jgi:predicted lipid carrier protein YhbT
LPLLQPILGHIVRETALRHPRLFARLGPHAQKTFLMDITNLPFVLWLRPDPAAPELRAMRRRALPACDATIRGSFLTLLQLVDGRLDGDALFFSRAIQVTGDTEAIVCLRNALDDLDMTLAEIVAGMFGPGGLGVLRRVGAGA